MELHRFIREQMEAILAEWDAFALTITPPGQLSHLALRDHAKQILRAIALDIETYQSSKEQIEKSQGLALDPNVDTTAASIHGALRQENNFSLMQLSAEFRALRATVLRLWLPQVETMSPITVHSMIRFNEAIDQALSESIAAYSESADQTRELFLAILGHDLRAPLATMAASGELLGRPQVPVAKIPEIGARVRRSVKLMNSMVDDLLGYTRTKLGVGIPTVFEAVDLHAMCQSAVDDAGALHPATRFELTMTGALVGTFDSVRVIQMLTNLLKNAAQYGEKGQAVEMYVIGDTDAVMVKVRNYGLAIPENSLQSIFQPLVQLSTEGDDDARSRTSLGLGLYVARETALAHGGTISVESNETDGTTFTVCLPKGD
ncbi:sensor histidine kinase [Caballeronia sp. SBC2]|uniref:sensor histidine kinase n=1 Tax=Caballeronia sp. SBC2 TaxID=2705547 RepID=UPI0013E14C3A|nr:sensor histidine kinase [Caballeronia sp. SBC2]QIE29683.1 Adaptive-response sensory-kinase SasA [Caballeronia sp. SBC2]